MRQEASSTLAFIGFKDTQTLKAFSNFLNRKGVLLMTSNIKSGSQNLLSFIDPGSNLTMITHAAARALCLKGLDICMALTKVENQTKISKAKSIKCNYVVKMVMNG